MRIRQDWAIIGLLAIGTIAVFLPVGQHEFVNFDDYTYVTHNPVVQAGLTWPGVSWAFRQFSGEWTYWHPLTWLSHMLDCQFFSLRPAGHHLGNLFFHTLNTVLLFVLLARMTGRRGASAVVAAFFALHPLQVDSVAWVAERKNVLSTLFWLLTLLAYVRYSARPGWARYMLVFVLMALGLMAKPMLVTLPCIMLLLDFWPLRRLAWFQPKSASSSGRRAGFKVETQESKVPISAVRLLLEKIPLFALSAASSLITIWGHRATGALADTQELPVSVRLANAVVGYAIYLRKLVFPTDLSVLYVHAGQWPAAMVIGSALLLLGITVWALLRIRQQPHLIVGWLWFIGALVPTIGLIQAQVQVEGDVQSLGDRFAYVPVIGLFVLIVWTVGSWTERWPRFAKGIQLTLAGLALVACIAMTSVQLRYWQNSITLLERAVQVVPGNSMAHVMLGNAYFEGGQLDGALREYEEARRLRQNDPLVWDRVGVVLMQQNKAAEALPCFDTAIRIAPGWPEPRRQMALALLRLGRDAEARTIYQTLASLMPATAESRRDLADLLAEGRQFSDAIDSYREALRLKPDFQAALNNLAWLRACCPQAEFRNGGEAVELAERACQLSQHHNADFLGTLAAAYAEAGRFDAALDRVQKALFLAQGSSSTNLLRQMLEQFRAGKPFRK